MRELTESESTLAAEILAERKPMYFGQKTVVNFQRIDGGDISFNPEPPQSKMLVDLYSIEFEAYVSKSGTLVWVPKREI